MHAVGGVVGAGAGDDAGPVTDRLEHCGKQRSLLVVGGGRRLPVVPDSTSPSHPESTRWVATPHRRATVSIVPSGLNGVTIAVSTVPNWALTSIPLVLTET